MIRHGSWHTHLAHGADMAQLADSDHSRLRVSILINTISLPTMTSLPSLPSRTCVLSRARQNRSPESQRGYGGRFSLFAGPRDLAQVICAKTMHQRKKKFGVENDEV